MNKIAFFVTIYPPHFQYLKNFQKSYYKFNYNKQSDLWLVFTNEEERMQFGEYDKSIVIHKNEHVSKGQGLVIIKKFRALKELKDKYKYIINIDSESIFVKEMNLHKLCEDFFTDKVLYGNSIIESGIDRAENIKRECKKYFEYHPEYNKLNTHLYLWFNQLCIYDSHDISVFFDIIEYDKFINKANFYTFDYYLYMYYLILYKNFKIEDIEVSSYYGFCGENNRDNCIFYSSRFREIKFNLCTNEFYQELDKSAILILCHLDREVTDKILPFKKKLANSKIFFVSLIKFCFTYITKITK